jgi:cysteinyl-tRNA synthetase
VIQIFDSLQGKKVELVPIEPGKIRLYVCGMTVYDDCHLGHARVMVFFDLVYRVLSKQYDVCYVRNITDVDDKIIDRAQQLGVDMASITERYIQSMEDDHALLGNKQIDHQPKATDFIQAMIQMIEQLIQGGFAYERSGTVYFEVAKDKRYGVLAKQEQASLKAGARLAVSREKKSEGDFVLWKPKKTGEPSWPSPWGDGRPGWHSECAAMVQHYFGPSIDIHGGGGDLKFPHHENERAQVESLSCKTFVRQWMHVGHVTMGETKMSKSLGNFKTLKVLFQQYAPVVIRFFLLSSHYRHPAAFVEQSIEQAHQTLLGLAEKIALSADQLVDGDIQDFWAALYDDFNTPLAIQLCHQAASNVKEGGSCGLLVNMLDALGFSQIALLDLLQDLRGLQIDQQQIENQITTRQQARQNKQYAQADQIRQELLAHGIELRDQASGTIWRRTVVNPYVKA